ncbi:MULTISPECIES: AMP-binding protein [unclassified Aeromicrobium]|uniref:class I adenylate-forming enzyme family protein n=1 Tax=unclassified Aeromicrobium TaxID=2633570 RepID=UPI0028898277|nr:MULTISPECIES: AMP-binding protein [unclassified Aeromicrobium]
MTNAVRNIWRHADERPDQVALREGTGSWTYAQVRAMVQHSAGELRRRGVGRGDTVLLVLPTSAEFVFTYYGVLSLGATAVTVNTLSTTPELEYFLTDADCVLAIGFEDSCDPLGAAAANTGRTAWMVGPGSIEGLDGAVSMTDFVEVERDDAAALLYTSGTTGRPKGAVLTHGNLLDSAEALSTVQGSGPEDRLGTALPLFHVYGQVPVMAAIHHVGGSLSLLRRFDAVAMLETVVEHGLTEVAGVPTMWNEMLHAQTPLTRDDLAGLRICLSGGAPLPVAVKLAFRERFGAHIVDGYGLTETSGAATCGSEQHELKEGSVGRAVPGTTLAILDPEGKVLPVGEVGEVAIDGRGVMREYWNRPEANESVRSGRWFRTGDVGRMDDDGDLWIVGRLKELIIRGGYNVYPSEVEEVIYSHPAVLECAVIGIPDDRLGEEVAAVLVFKPGHSVEPSEMRLWLQQRLSAYKVPRVYQVSDALPKGATGKILKREIDPESVKSTGRLVRHQLEARG